MRTRVLCAVLLPVSWLAADAAMATSRDDVETVAEHLAEAFQEARFLALPWPVDGSSLDDLPREGWQGVVDVGATEAGAGSLRERAALVLVGAARRLGPATLLQGYVFDDEARVSGDSAELLLDPPFATPPALALPAGVRLTEARGTLRHAGVGAGWIRRVSPKWSWQLGLVVDRLELSNYRADFEILSGPGVGQRGVIDHGGSGTFVTPLLGVQRTFRPSGVWSVRLRTLGGAPLPPADFHTRLITGAFSAATSDPSGRPGKIGDGFLSLGVGLLHRRSGFEVDLGSALWFPLFQPASHDGVDRALLLHVTWHF